METENYRGIFPFHDLISEYEKGDPGKSRVSFDNDKINGATVERLVAVGSLAPASLAQLGKGCCFS